MSVAVSNHRGAYVSSASPSVATSVNAKAFSDTAEIVSYPKRKLPPVADYAKLCKGLIEETFWDRSQHRICLNAAMATGEPVATFCRILSGETKSPDAKLMLAVMAIRAAMGKRTFDLGNGFAIRIIMEGQE